MRKTVLMSLAILGLSACATSQEGVPDVCSLPDGIEVATLQLDDSQAGEINATGETGFRVTATLTDSVPQGELAVVCYAVRDSEVVRGAPLAVGFIGITSGDGDSATRDDNFRMTCDDGEVAGRAITDLNDMDDFDRSSGERSTRIFIQHLEGIRRFAGMDVGIRGETSNRIRVSCPR